MQLLTKGIRKKGPRPGQGIEPAGGTVQAKIWVCRPCGIQRRAQ
jgi:hypothetical protein